MTIDERVDNIGNEMMDLDKAFDDITDCLRLKNLSGIMAHCESLEKISDKISTNAQILRTRCGLELKKQGLNR